MFTARKLTGGEILFFSLCFFNEMTPQSYVLRTEETEVTTRDCISHPNTHAHTHVYMFSEIFTGILEEFSVSAN